MSFETFIGNLAAEGRKTDFLGLRNSFRKELSLVFFFLEIFPKSAVYKQFFRVIDEHKPNDKE